VFDPGPRIDPGFGELLEEHVSRVSHLVRLLVARDFVDMRIEVSMGVGKGELIAQARKSAGVIEFELERDGHPIAHPWYLNTANAFFRLGKEMTGSAPQNMVQYPL